MKKAVPRDGSADRALVDELAAGLMRAAEERVGRAADAQRHARLRRLRGACAPRPSSMPSGFSEWTCLPAASAFKPDLHVRRRDRQIDDDLDRRDRASSSVDRHRAGSPNCCARASAASGRMSATPLMSRIGKC